MKWRGVKWLLIGATITLAVLFSYGVEVGVLEWRRIGLSPTEGARRNEEPADDLAIAESLGESRRNLETEGESQGLARALPAVRLLAKGTGLPIPNEGGVAYFDGLPPLCFRTNATGEVEWRDYDTLFQSGGRMVVTFVLQEDGLARLSMWRPLSVSLPESLRDTAAGLGDLELEAQELLISGRVVDQSGQAIQAVSVSLSVQGDSGLWGGEPERAFRRSSVDLTVETRADGSFEIRRASDARRVRAYLAKDGYSPTIHEVGVQGGEYVTLVMSRTGEVEGQLLLPDGVPMEATRFVVVDSHGRRIRVEAAWREELGGFLLSGLDSGPSTLEVSCAGVGVIKLIQDIDIPAGGVAWLGVLPIDKPMFVWRLKVGSSQGALAPGSVIVTTDSVEGVVWRNMPSADEVRMVVSKQAPLRIFAYSSEHGMRVLELIGRPRTVEVIF